MAWVMAACNPALNWRQLTLADKRVSLPCKPDQGARSIQLAGHTLNMSMIGCEADNHLFAISHVRLANSSDLAMVLQAWHSAAMNNLGSSPLSEALQLETIYDAYGQDVQQRKVSAQLMWRQEGLDLYHWAVYANTLKPESVEPMFLPLH